MRKGVREVRREGAREEIKKERKEKKKLRQTENMTHPKLTRYPKAGQEQVSIYPPTPPACA